MRAIAFDALAVIGALCVLVFVVIIVFVAFAGPRRRRSEPSNIDLRRSW